MPIPYTNMYPKSHPAIFGEYTMEHMDVHVGISQNGAPYDSIFNGLILKNVGTLGQQYIAYRS